MRARKTASEFLRIRAQTPIIFITLAISADLSCSLHPRSDDLAAERWCYPVLLAPGSALVCSILAPDQELNGSCQCTDQPRLRPPLSGLPAIYPLLSAYSSCASALFSSAASTPLTYFFCTSGSASN